MSAADSTQDVKTVQDILAQAKGVDGSITALLQYVVKRNITIPS